MSARGFLSKFGIARVVWAQTTRALTDKAGFTLTANSYNVLGAAVQRGSFSLTNGNAAANSSAISGASNRLHVTGLGESISSDLLTSNSRVRIALNAGQITATRGGTTNDIVISYEARESAGTF